MAMAQNIDSANEHETAIQMTKMAMETNVN